MQFAVNKPFDPITIILTSQAEVDFYYTLVVNAPDAMVGDFGLGAEVDQLTCFLADFASDDCFNDEWDVEDFYPALDEPVEDFCQGCAGCNTSMYQHKAQRIEQPMQREHSCKGGCEACIGCNASDSNYEGEIKNDFKNDFKPAFQQSFQINSQEEADILKALLGACHSNIDSEFGASSWDMFQRIKGASSRNGSNLTIELNK